MSAPQRRYFICPLSVVTAHRDAFHPAMAWYAYHLLPADADGNTGYDPQSPDPQLADPMVLVSAAFNSEFGEETFSGHPEVACLPHPQFEGTVKIADINLDQTFVKGGQQVKIPEADHPHRAKKFRQKHLAALRHCRQLGHDEATDTVLDLHLKAIRCWPDMKLRYLY